MEEQHLTCADVVQLMDDLGIGNMDLALIAGVRDWKLIDIVRYNMGTPITLTQIPVFSQLGIDVLQALHSTVQAITDPAERHGLGLYLTNELRTRGAGYVAWKILNAQHRESWVPEAP